MYVIYDYDGVYATRKSAYDAAVLAADRYEFLGPLLQEWVTVCDYSTGKEISWRDLLKKIK